MREEKGVGGGDLSRSVPSNCLGWKAYLLSDSSCHIFLYLRIRYRQAGQGEANDSVVELRKLDPYFPSILLIDKTPLPLGATLFEFIIRSIRPAREDGICVGVDVKAVREERLVV